MSFKILADTFSVSRDSDHYIQVKNLKNPRTEDEMWLVFEVSNSPKFARATVQNIIDTFEEIYFDNFNLPAYERFENTLKEVNLIYKSLKEKKGEKMLGTISALATVFANGDLLLTQTRDAEAYMIRKSKLSLISEGLSGRSEDLFVNIASGELLPEDKVLFTTSRLLRLATHNQLVQMCSDGVTETMDSLRELVLGDSELSIGIAFVHVKLPQRSIVALPIQKNGFHFPFMEKIA